MLGEQLIHGKGWSISYYNKYHSSQLSSPTHSRSTATFSMETFFWRDIGGGIIKGMTRHGIRSTSTELLTQVVTWRQCRFPNGEVQQGSRASPPLLISMFGGALGPWAPGGLGAWRAADLSACAGCIRLPKSRGFRVSG